jgi:hypothetical protein
MSALKADRLALLDGISSVAIVNPVAKATAAAPAEIDALPPCGGYDREMIFRGGIQARRRVMQGPRRAF